jgi:hypothetical protein
MAIQYLLLLTIFLTIGVRLCKIQVNKKLQYEFSPRLMLVISYYVYSIALPISRLFFTNMDKRYDVEYMWVQLMGAAGILFGLVFHRFYLKFTCKRKAELVQRKYLPEVAIIIMAFATGVTAFNSFKGLGWNVNAIFTPYGFESSLKTRNVNPTLFGEVVSFFAISSVVLSFVGAKFTNNKKLIFIILLFCGIFSLFFLVRGARNMSGMMVIPIIGVYLYAKPIKILNLILPCLGIYLILCAVGFIRNWGFAQIEDVKMQVEIFDPLGQEFGTNYNVFTKWKEGRQDKALLFGKSYTRDVLINIVPRRLWLNRPPGLAAQFSMEYFKKSAVKELPSGLGFSPVVEALMNFSYIGIVPIFAVFSYLIILIEYWFMQKGAWGIACYAFMIPMVINWNRIDMATTVKIFMIFFVVSKVFAIVMYRKNKISKLRLVNGR